MRERPSAHQWHPAAIAVSGSSPERFSHIFDRDPSRRNRGDSSHPALERVDAHFLARRIAHGTCNALNAWPWMLPGHLRSDKLDVDVRRRCASRCGWTFGKVLNCTSVCPQVKRITRRNSEYQKRSLHQAISDSQKLRLARAK